MIQQNQLTPNIATFGCLAYKVSNTEQLDEYLRDLKVNFKIFSLVNSSSVFYYPDFNSYPRKKKTLLVLSKLGKIYNKRSLYFLISHEVEIQKKKIDLLDFFK